MMNNVNNLAANLWAVNNEPAGAKRSPTQKFELPASAHEVPTFPENADAPGTFVAAAFRVPGGGFMSARVSKAESFSAENPVMLVSGVDVCGTRFEKEIDIREINPNNASFIELLAFDGFSQANGKSSQTARIAARAMLMQELNGKEFSEFNAFTQLDFAGALRGFMESLRTTQNYEAFIWVNSNVEQFFKHFDIERQGA